MKSSRLVISTLVALALAAMLSGCGKNATPTGVNPIDEAPPAAPSQITSDMDPVTTLGRLEWTPSASANVASYQIYQYSPSPTRESAYVLVGETNSATTHYDLAWSYTPATLHYRLRAVSGTGVMSEWSALATVTVGPSPAGSDQGQNPGDEPTRIPMKH